MSQMFNISLHRCHYCATDTAVSYCHYCCHWHCIPTTLLGAVVITVATDTAFPRRCCELLSLLLPRTLHSHDTAVSCCHYCCHCHCPQHCCELLSLLLPLHCIPTTLLWAVVITVATTLHSHHTAVSCCNYCCHCTAFPRHWCELLIRHCASQWCVSRSLEQESITVHHSNLFSGH